MGRLGGFLRQGFIVVFLGTLRIEGQGELILPAELEAGLRKRIIANLGSGVSLGEVGRMGGDLVGDDALADIVLIRQTQVFLRGDVAQHRRPIPTNHRGANGGRDVVIARGDVGRKGPERIERCLMAPLQLLIHVLLDHVHRHVAGAFIHDLHPAIPGPRGKFALRLQFGKLRVVVCVSNRARTESVANGEADVVSGHDIADIIPLSVEEILLVVR